MSLESRLADLVTALGADVKKFQARSNLPSYAPLTVKNAYDSKLNVYNLKGSNSRHAHAGIARALNGGVMNILGLADSAFSGYDGTANVCKEWRAIPRLVGRFMGQSLGLSNAGGMVMPAVSPGLVATDKIVDTGSDTIATGCCSLAAGATQKFTSQNAGTIAEVYYSNLSASFTVTIDSGTPVTVTPTGAATMGRYQVTGLTDATHTILVTAPTSYAIISAYAIRRSVGISVDNISWGGARAAVGGPTTAWLDTSAAANIQSIRKGSYDLRGVTPDLVVSTLGGNDVPNGVTGDDFATSYATIRSWYPNSDFIFMIGPGLSTATQANWDAFCGRMYKMADDLDIALLDIRDRVGYATEANSLGYIGPDGYHETQGAMFDWARLIANAYTGSGPGQFLALPAGSYSLSEQPDGLVVGDF